MGGWGTARQASEKTHHSVDRLEDVEGVELIHGVGQALHQILQSLGAPDHLQLPLDDPALGPLVTHDLDPVQGARLVLNFIHGRDEVEFLLRGPRRSVPGFRCGAPISHSIFSTPVAHPSVPSHLALDLSACPPKAHGPLSQENSNFSGGQLFPRSRLADLSPST